VPQGSHARSEFPTTRWSIVLAAGDWEPGQDDGAAATRAALEWLCERYWQPLYLYTCRRCFNPELGRDLTQEFIATVLERNWLHRADPHRGRFRAFLLTSLKRFLADRYDHDQAQKRGGGQTAIDLACSGSEDRLQREFADQTTPELLYERQWAITLLERVIEGLREHFQGTGGLAQFDALKPFLMGDDQDYRGTAAALDMSEGAVRIAVHRLRKLFQRRFREEIAETVATPEEAEEEIRYLLNVLSQSPAR